MKQNRPTSPHLSIYKWQITSVLSILHRFTGIALFVSILLIAIGFSCLALSSTKNHNALVEFFLQNPLSTHCICLKILFSTIIFGFIFSFSYHFLNGIRYFFWSFAKGMSLGVVTISAYLVIVVSVVVSIASVIFVMK